MFHLEPTPLSLNKKKKVFTLERTFCDLLDLGITRVEIQTAKHTQTYKEKDFYHIFI